MNDSDDSTLFSRSLLRRRHRPSQANVRSTVHRIGNFTQPSASFGRRTMLRSQSAFASTHSYSFMLWYFESAYIGLVQNVRSQGNTFLDGRPRCSARKGFLDK